MIVVLFSTVDRPGIDDEEYGQTRDRMQEQEAWVQASSAVHEYRWTQGVGYESDLREMFVAG